MSRMDVMSAKTTTADERTFLVAKRAARGAMRIAPGVSGAQLPFKKCRRGEGTGRGNESRGPAAAKK